MKPKLIWIALFLSVLLVSLSTGTHIVKAESNNQPSSYKVVQILAPQNKTYDSRLLTLEVTFPASCLRYSLNYDLDGKYDGPVPFSVVNPKEVHVVYEARGTVELPVLSDGAHCVTVTIECSVDIYGGNSPSGPFKPTTPGGTHFVATWSDTVYFTIDPDAPKIDSTPPATSNPPEDTTPPRISDISLENKTYLETNVPLNFTVNENTMQVVYSMDGRDNVTIAGNTTLTGLSFGAHNLTIYAWDDSGNVGVSKPVNFDVTDTTPEKLESSNPSSIALTGTVSGVSAVVVGVCSLIYFRKRRQQ